MEKRQITDRHIEKRYKERGEYTKKYRKKKHME